MLQHISVNREILSDPRYDYLFTVEEVNKRVLQGIPFREAYQQVGREVQQGSFHTEKRYIIPTRKHRQPLHRRDPGKMELASQLIQKQA